MTVPSNQLRGKLIAFFHQSADLYGSDRVLLDLASAVQAEGGTAVVLLPNTGPLTEVLATRGIEFHVLPVVKLTRARMSVKGLISLAREALASIALYDHIFSGRRVDLVHSNTIAVLGGALWAKHRRYTHLWHVHEIIVQPRIAAYAFPRLVCALAHHVICNSNATRTWLQSVRPGLEAKMSVIWNGVEAVPVTDVAAVEALRQQYRPGGVRLAVGLLGRINRLKGHNVLLEAAELLHLQGFRDFSIVFIGSPPPGQDIYLEQLKQRIELSPVKDRVVLRGFSGNVWPVYEALDVVCVPSTEPESFGLVAAEAMAAGKPVLASRIGALGEIIEDGTTGILFPALDAAALAISLLHLYQNEATRLEMGVNGADRIRSEFSTTQMRERLMKYYTKEVSTLLPI